MTDKKIIDKKHIKENNPNDDEEILKNMDANVKDEKDNPSIEDSKNEKEKTDGSETLGIP